MRVMDITIEKMLDQVSEWEKSDDQRYIFLKCYALMSGNVAKCIKQGRFRHSVWVENLMVHFAEYYFDALYKYESKEADIPSVWKHVHDVTIQYDNKVVRKLLLGVNAHINYDLPLSLYDCLKDDWQYLNITTKKSKLSDHLLINKVISDTIDHVQDSIISPRSKVMAIMDNALGRLDEWLISGLISSWRQEVWESAVCMLETPELQTRTEIVKKLEKKVLGKAYLYAKINV